MLRAGYRNKEGKEMLRAGFGSKDFQSKGFQLKKKLIPPHPLTNFEIEKYYQNEPRFNGVCSRDNLYKNIKYGAYVINLDEYADAGTQ